MNKEEIIGYEALYNSMEKCKHNVSWKPSVGYFIHNWPTEIGKLSDSLNDGTYTERKPKYFTIYEPKVREIMSVSFRDRVYQRSLNDVALYPQTSKSYILDNHACQRGKGNSLALKRLKGFLQSYYRKYGTEGYVLQFDIKGFYPNMRHNIAKEVLNSYIDEATIEMSNKILDDFEGDVGFNPGSQIVQIVGVTLLDKLDHLIKEKLGIEYYDRFMDDGVLIHHDLEYLKYCKEVIEEELGKLFLNLNPKKTRIYKITDGIKFLGFIHYLKPSGKVVIIATPEKIKHERKKLFRMANLVKEGKLSEDDFYTHFKCVKACLRYGNSYTVIHNLNDYVKELMRWKHEDKKI